MRVDVTLEFRFHRTPDGAAWTDGAFPRPFWDRYLEVFDAVRVIARAHPAESPPPGARRVDGGAVEFWPVPLYVGPAQFARRYREVRERVRAGVEPDDAVILRIASPLAALLHPLLRRRAQPYGIEMVGDPLDTFARGSIDHPARWLARRWLTSSSRRLAAGAAAAAYVTAAALQRRYPPGPKAFTTHYSSIDLPDEALAEQPRAPSGRARRLVTVAALDQRYKGVDVLLEAVAARVAAGCDLTLTVVGEGRLRSELEDLTAALGLDPLVEFTGQVPPSRVVEILDSADMFVLASRTEGLPRALVEAMARGLPAVATAVGGVPELLAAEDMVPAGSAAALAAKLGEVANAPDRLGRMAARNLGTAARYRASVLAPRRTELYRRVRAVSEARLGATP